MKNGGLLSRDQILSAPDLTFEEVEVKEWNGVIRIRELSAGDRERIADLVKEKGGFSREIVIALSAVDKDGNQLFTPDDVVELAKKSEAAIQGIASAATKLSGIGKEATEIAEKKFDPSRSVDSTID